MWCKFSRFSMQRELGETRNSHAPVFHMQSLWWLCFAVFLRELISLFTNYYGQSTCKQNILVTVLCLLLMLTFSVRSGSGTMRRGGITRHHCNLAVIGYLSIFLNFLIVILLSIKKWHPECFLQLNAVL